VIGAGLADGGAATAESVSMLINDLVERCGSGRSGSSCHLLKMMHENGKLMAA
jgi:hypothetical protein